MSQRAILPSADDLKVLRSPGVVAYSVRCARRVLPLYSQATGIPCYRKHKRAIEEVLTLAEQYCRGRPTGLFPVADVARATGVTERIRSAWEAAGCAADVAQVIGSAGLAAAFPAWYFFSPAWYVASSTWYVASATFGKTVAPDAGNKAAQAAMNAAALALAEPAFVDAAQADYTGLLWLNLEYGASQQAGTNPAENGPLGPLWPKRPPDWFK